MVALTHLRHLPSVQGLGYQALQVGRDGAQSTIDNALSQAIAFNLTPKVALSIAREVAQGVAQWRAHEVPPHFQFND